MPRQTIYTIWKTICNIFSCDYFCEEKMCKELADEAAKALSILKDIDHILRKWEEQTPWPD